MKRRDFGILGIMGLGAGMTSCIPYSALKEHSPGKPEKLIPEKLSDGDTVGLIAPASPFSAEIFEKAVRQLDELGLKIKYGANLHKEYGYVAGSDQERLDDIHAMFADPEVKAIWCIRGGYGTTRLLPGINYELIRKNPKILIGYSDITALLHAIYQKTGLVCFHGPVAASTMTDYTKKHLKNVLFGTETAPEISNYVEGPEEQVFTPEVLVPGKCRGELVGGNLSLLAAMAGTAFGFDATDNIVFIEDIGEKPYRIDRMLTQLRQSANLNRASGILLGRFHNCEASEGELSLSLKETLVDRLSDLGIPVYYGFSFGHIDNMCTLPVGAKASFDTAKAVLILEEPVVN